MDTISELGSAFYIDEHKDWIVREHPTVESIEAQMMVYYKNKHNVVRKKKNLNLQDVIFLYIW